MYMVRWFGTRSGAECLEVFWYQYSNDSLHFCTSVASIPVDDSTASALAASEYHVLEELRL